MAIRVYSAIECYLFRDERFLKLDSRGRQTWLYLLGQSSRAHIPGLVECSYVDLTRFLDYPLRVSDRKRFGEALKQTGKDVRVLIDLDWVLYDRNAELFYLPKALKHNLPDNKFMLVGWLKRLREKPSSPLLRHWLADAQVVFRRAYGNQDDRFRVIQSACRTVSGKGSLKVVKYQVSKGIYDGYPRPYTDGLNSALARAIDEHNTIKRKIKIKKKQEKETAPPTATLPSVDMKPDASNEDFTERQKNLWDIFRTETFFVKGRGAMTVLDAVSDSVSLCEKLGGDGFKDVSLDLVYTLAAWSVSNKGKARKNLGAFLTACFSKEQKKAVERQRIDAELAVANQRIKTFDVTHIEDETADDQTARVEAMRKAGFAVD